MRSARQKLYDDFYYNFERRLVAVFENFRVLRRTAGQRFDPAVKKAFREEIRPYWARFGVRAKLRWVKDNYLVNGSLDPRYIPNDLYITKIVPHFNPLDSVNTLTDKNLTDLLYPDMKQPETVFRHMSGTYCLRDFSPISREEALALLEPGMACVIKPARDSSEGMDVCFFTDPAQGAALADRYAGIDYIVQKAIRQHPGTAALNGSSVNTLRLVTLLFRGEARLLSAILRAGSPGSQVDNIGAGGWQYTIRPDGTLTDTAYASRNGRPVFVKERHGELVFAGRAIPAFDRVRDTALALAARTPHLKLIAWDFAVDENGDVVLIELNASMPGQNQETCGPTFGDLTDRVLAEVFGKDGSR